MTTHTNGQICYGVIISTEDDEGEIVFPWDKYEDGYGIEDWWIYDALRYCNPFEMFTKEGGWIGGKEWPKEKIKQYYAERREFLAEHPLPVTLVNYCYIDEPLYILAIPETLIEAYRGSPEVFTPASLVVTDKQEAALLDFCKTYGIEYKGEPQWYLSSYWG